MPATGFEYSQKAVDVAQRYLRRERSLSALVVVLAVSIFLSTYLVASLLPGALVAVIVLVGVRFPVLRSDGTFRLRTSDGLDTVIDVFAGSVPPVLAVQ